MSSLVDNTFYFKNLDWRIVEDSYARKPWHCFYCERMVEVDDRQCVARFGLGDLDFERFHRECAKELVDEKDAVATRALSRRAEARVSELSSGEFSGRTKYVVMVGEYEVCRFSNYREALGAAKLLNRSGIVDELVNLAVLSPSNEAS